MVKLTVIQFGVEPALLQQALVISLLHDVAVPHDQNGIRVPDGGQPVGHDEAGAALHHLLEGLLDADFRAG